MPMVSESLPQLAHRLARPSDQALWISFWVQHPFQIGSQRCIRDGPLFPATALLAYTLPQLIKRSCLQFCSAFADRFSGDSSLTGCLADPSHPNAPDLYRYVQPPLSL